MANIKEKIDNIRQAIFGKDVRESLASGLEEVNGESERTSEKQKKLETTFNDLIINAGNSNAEIVAARKGHETVGERLDNFDSQLDTFAKKDDVAKISSGTPVFVSSVSEMTDTTKNYVNITDGYLYTYNGNEFENSNVKYQEMGLSNNQVSLMNLSQFIQSNYSLREWAIHYNELKTGKYMYKYNNTIMEGTMDGVAYKKIIVDDYDLVKIKCDTGGSSIVSVFGMDSNNQIIYNSNTNYSGTFNLDVSKCSYIIINSYGTSIRNCSVTPYTLKYEKTSLDNYLKLTSNELEKSATVNYYFQYDNKYNNYYSNVYDVKNHEKVKLKGDFNEYMNYITLFDNKGDIVSYNIGLKGINEIEINVNNADYLLVSTSENLMSSIKILTYDIIGNETINDFTPSFSMFEKFGVIGDSYASGEVAINGYIDYYNVSWGQILARMSGNKCINFSSGGLSTRTWLTHEKGLTLLNSSEPQQLYICALGINDYYHLGESYLGTIADIQTKVDTFYGNYAKIIESVKQKAPNAKIIMLTTTGYHSVVMKFNKAITEIANYYNIPCLVQNDDAFFNSSFYTNNMVSGHPLAIVYSSMAKTFRRMIEKCMYDNLSYFRDFIG